MRVLRSIVLSIAALLALAPLPAAAQQEVSNPPDPWVHAATGTRFPATVGQFQRGRVVEYSDDGHDASVGYSMARDDDRLSVTLYVYPVVAGLNCVETYQDAKASIARYAGTQLVSESRERAPGGVGAPAAYHARYFIPAGSMAANLPAVRSELYLYCPPGDEWLVKYRATWGVDTDFAGDVETLLHAIDWPDSLGG